jgi:hypothetical protein
VVPDRGCGHLEQRERRFDHVALSFTVMRCTQRPAERVGCDQSTRDAHLARHVGERADVDTDGGDPARLQHSLNVPN